MQFYCKTAVNYFAYSRYYGASFSRTEYKIKLLKAADLLVKKYNKHAKTEILI